MSDGSSFDAIGGNLALDLVNTVANRGNVEKRRDLLGDLSDLRNWFARVGLEAKDLIESDVVAARAIRERLHDLFRLPADGLPVDEATLAAFNAEFQAAASQRMLAPKNGHVIWGWRADTDALRKSLFPVLSAAAELLVSSDLEKVRECQGAGCGWLFVDRSRGRPRRWCSMRDCGNKAKARRHYHRQAGP